MERLIRPYICFNDVEEDLRRIFESGILTKGAYVDRFREVIRDYTGTQYSFLSTSATTALWVSLKAAGVRPGDEVILSDFSFPATANVVEDLGAIPVFADVDIRTFNMRPDELEKKISGKTKVVMFVDALGNPSGLLAIREICRRKGLILIEDAACAFGSSIEGVKCGNIADITCFSFHPRKLLTTGEGGAITTNNEAIARFLEVKLNHGAVSRDGKMDFVDFGYNFRMSEIQAAMGIKQVERIDEITAHRREVRDRYRERLAPLGFVPQESDSGVSHNVQSVVFVVPAGTDRDALIAHLAGDQIETTIGTYCLSGTTYYRTKYAAVQPSAQRLQKTTITLPCSEGVDVERVCESVAVFCTGR